MDNNDAKSFLQRKQKNLLLNKNGNPLILYHGTNRIFDKHDMDKNRTILNDRFQGDWICYTSDIDVAWKYTHAARNQCLNKEVFLEETYLLFNKDINDKFTPYLYDLTISILDNGYEKGWDIIEKKYVKDMIENKQEYTWNNFFRELDQYSKNNNDFDINDFLDVLDYVEYSKSTRDSEPAMNLFSNSVEVIPDSDIQYLINLGYTKSIPEPKVISSHIYADSILETSDRDQAKTARDNGYDLVIYTGEGTVDGEPEYLIANPYQITIKETTIQNSKTISVGLNETQTEYFYKTTRNKFKI